jgi:serine/threonine protein kinase
VYLIGVRISQYIRLRNVYPIDLPLSQALLASVYLIGMHLIAMHPFTGVYFTGVCLLCVHLRASRFGLGYISPNPPTPNHPASLQASVLEAQPRTLRSRIFIISPCSSKAMNSAQSLASSVNCVDQYYPEVSAQDEVLQRPNQTNNAIGQSSFFTLLLRLNVPILGRSRNRDAQDFLFVGQGASYVVTQALAIVNRTKDGFLNEMQPGHSMFTEALRSKAFVMKRIVPIPSQAADDSRQLAAITNEVRILANESVRNAKCIVRLLGVAWDEIPTAGRYWPRLLIEVADYGTLGDFLANTTDAGKLDVKIELLLDVLDGLKSLHTEGLVHCDLKLENVLVFRSDADRQTESPFRYRAKLCDFGFAIIQRDYEGHSSFCARLGTEPWNAPELMGDTEVEIADLPKADIYSFGLLFSRVLLQGENPFKDISAEYIRELKRRADDSDTELTTIKTIIYSTVSLEPLSDDEKAAIELILRFTLAQRPDDRFSIPNLATLLLYLEVQGRR